MVRSPECGAGVSVCGWRDDYPAPGTATWRQGTTNSRRNHITSRTERDGRTRWAGAPDGGRRDIVVAMNSAGGRPRTAEVLDLAPHPEGGWYRQTWRSGPDSVPPGYPGSR